MYIIDWLAILYRVLCEIWGCLAGKRCENVRVIGRKGVETELPKLSYWWWAHGTFTQTILVELLWNWFKPMWFANKIVVRTDDNQDLILETINWQLPLEDTRAVLVFMPGIAGKATNTCYVRPWLDVCKGHGFRGVVINRRGTTSPLTYEANRLPTHADSEDIRQIIGHLRGLVGGESKKKIIGIGYSAGGNHLASVPDLFDMLFCLCSNHKLVETARYLLETPYSNRLLGLGIREVMEKNDICGDHKHKGLTDYDDIIAKRLGFECVVDYWNSVSTVESLKKSPVPTYCIFSRDDPLLRNFEPVLEEICNENPRVVGIVTESGGHAAWIMKNGEPWIVKVVLNIITSQLNN